MTMMNSKHRTDPALIDVEALRIEARKLTEVNGRTYRENLNLMAKGHSYRDFSTMTTAINRWHRLKAK